MKSSTHGNHGESRKKKIDINSRKSYKTRKSKKDNSRIKTKVNGIQDEKTNVSLNHEDEKMVIETHQNSLCKEENISEETSAKDESIQKEENNTSKQTSQRISKKVQNFVELLSKFIKKEIYKVPPPKNKPNPIINMTEEENGEIPSNENQPKNDFIKIPSNTN